jgi:hypothetical protein
MDFERDHLLLDGSWERLFGHPDAELWMPQEAAAAKWEPVELPGTLGPGRKRPENETVECVWLRRVFTLDARQAARQAVLKWGSVRFGATARLNGVELGSHATVGPATMLVPAGVTREGENVLVLKVNGWASLHKSSTGVPVIPVGADLHWGGRATTVNDSVYLEFYDRARIKWALAVPDLGAGAVTFRVWPESAVEMPDAMALSAAVRLDGAPVGSATAEVSGTGPLDLTVPLGEARPWTPEDPAQYEARLTLAADGRPCDDVAFRFGMRSIAVQGGHYRLNGRPLYFRGSNLVTEWNWSIQKNPLVKGYVIDEARDMSLNSFRTHTLPPPTFWLDVCDENGMMIMAEFSTTFNYRDYAFTPEEWQEWHRNVLTDATGWITKMWNHPCVVMWVLTNEPKGDLEWEAGPYEDAVLSLDPTRPCMRTGETTLGTRSLVDVHLCGNYCYGPNNSLITTCRELARKKDPERALGNSEYMNYLDKRENIWRRRLGSEQPADAALDFAQCAAEHTEAMRQLDFDLILPYMYSPWTRTRGNNWRPDFPTPMAAALHSSMAPVLASVELFDRNFRAGTEVASPLHLINELHESVKVRVDYYLTRDDPLFVPDGDALAAAVWSADRDLVLPADSHVVEPLRWLVPAEEGSYYLAVVLTREGERAVVSQRTVRSVGEPAASEGMRRVLVAGDGAALGGPLSALGVRHSPFTQQAAGKGGRLPEDPALRRAAEAFAEQGGRVVLVCMAKGGYGNKEEFDWPAPFTVEGTDGSMCVFPYPDADHALLRDIPPDWLRGWNGVPNVIADTFISGNVVERGEGILWEERDERPVALSLPMGKGEVVILALRLDGRLGPGERYDPVAERMVLNLLRR